MISDFDPIPLQTRVILINISLFVNLKEVIKGGLKEMIKGGSREP